MNRQFPMENDEQDELSGVFARYRVACPDREPSADFMPRLWAKIDQRSNLWFFFDRLGRPFAAAAAAVCLILILLNVRASTQSHGPAISYLDGLVTTHSAETLYFSEGVRSAPSDELRQSE